MHVDCLRGRIIRLRCGSRRWYKDWFCGYSSCWSEELRVGQRKRLKLSWCEGRNRFKVCFTKVSSMVRRWVVRNVGVIKEKNMLIKHNISRNGKFMRL